MVEIYDNREFMIFNVSQLGTIDFTKVLESKKRYRENNKNKISLGHKKWRENNKNVILLKSKKWYSENKEKKKQYQKEYNELNAENRRQYQTKRRKSQPHLSQWRDLLK